MELSGFVSNPHHTNKPLKIVSWIINGAKTKLEKRNVKDIFFEHIIILNEVKTPLRVCLPGYISFTSYDKDSALRGGITVISKNFLAREVKRVDTSAHDQVWSLMQCVSRLTFGASFIHRPTLSTFLTRRSQHYRKSS